MQRISISELCTSRWSFYQDVVRYASHGFDSIGIWRHKVDDFDLFETADYLFEMKMEVSSVHWAGGFTGGEGLTFDESIEDAINAIQMTSLLNADCLIVHPGCRNGHTFNHASRLFASALERLVPVAEDFGVVLAIEPMPCLSAAAWTFFQRFQSTLDLLEKFPTQHLGIVLDLYHVGLCDTAFDNLKHYAKRLKLVQLSDRLTANSDHESRLPLGSGLVPIGHWLKSLQQLDYRGKYELEIHGSAHSQSDYNELLSATSNFFQQPAAIQWTSVVDESKRSKI